MKKLIVSFVAVLSLVAFTSLVVAAEAPKTEPAKKVAAKAEMKAETIIGKIAKIDTAKNEIALKEKKGEKTFVVKAEDIGKLKVGEKVKLEVEKGTNKVEKLEVLKK